MDKLKQFIRTLNEKGIPLPLATDPKTGLASVSLTMMFISFNMCIIGLMGKAAGLLGGVDLGQALTLFGITASLYWGRKFQTKEITVEKEEVK